MWISCASWALKVSTECQLSGHCEDCCPDKLFHSGPVRGKKEDPVTVLVYHNYPKAVLASAHRCRFKLYKCIFNPIATIHAFCFIRTIL